LIQYIKNSNKVSTQPKTLTQKAKGLIFSKTPIESIEEIFKNQSLKNSNKYTLISQILNSNKNRNGTAKMLHISKLFTNNKNSKLRSNLIQYIKKSSPPRKEKVIQELLREFNNNNLNRFLKNKNSNDLFNLLNISKRSGVDKYALKRLLHNRGSLWNRRSNNGMFNFSRYLNVKPPLRMYRNGSLLPKEQSQQVVFNRTLPFTERTYRGGVPSLGSRNRGVPSFGSNNRVPSFGSNNRGGNIGVPSFGSNNRGVPSSTSNNPGGNIDVPSSTSNNRGVPSSTSNNRGVPS
jgi:hypothetical protein